MAEPPPEQLQPLQLPAAPTQEFVELLQQRLLKASWHGSGVAATSQVLHTAVAHRICTHVLALLKQEPTLLELHPPDGQRVTVVGDTHGHFQDLCGLFSKFGAPASDRIYIFNGDFVDRGAWGLETIMLLLAYKWLYPRQVYMIRGNHEASYCTKVYGFKEELVAKYGAAGRTLYKDFLGVFAQLPLAALVQDATLILHGGLFRSPPAKLKGQAAFKSLLDLPHDLQLETGSLDALRQAGKGGCDPDPEKRLSQLIASDVLWSDPSRLPGHHPNLLRGVGTRFGPDVTEAFLCANNLKLIIRSHEGPDARIKRPPDDIMPDVDQGFSEDHVTASGKLVTLFSAPCYPMFTAPDDAVNTNKGAVLHLSAPDYATPDVCVFEAVLPRPQCSPFYKMDGMSSDSETTEETVGQETSVSSMGRGAAAGREEDGATSKAVTEAAAEAPAADASPVAAAVFGAAVACAARQRSPKRLRSAAKR